MKYLGIDYGTKKTGLALSDEEGGFAFPYAIVSTEEVSAVVGSLFEKEPIAGIVVGYSLASNGQENTLTPAIDKIIETLSKYGVPVSKEQESFSSVEAHRYQTKKGDRDDSAAAIILQRFLDKKKK